jgi:acyl-coenzyme A synthetase/AMP-(fatty) acid ligase
MARACSAMNALWVAPGVAECAVIGVPHADFGEAVVAIVAPKPGSQTSSKNCSLTRERRSVRSFCNLSTGDFR